MLCALEYNLLLNQRKNIVPAYKIAMKNIATVNMLRKLCD